MKIKLATILVFALLGICAFAQDTRFGPKGQQIPVPDCLTVGEGTQTSQRSLTAASVSAKVRRVCWETMHDASRREFC